MVQYSQIVKAPLSLVWEHFLYKINHPENFVPGVSNVEVLERNDAYVIRAMDLTFPDNNNTSRVVEQISCAPFWVKFLILEHPTFEGYVENLAEPISGNETKITFSIHWKNKKTGASFDHQEIAKNAVLKTIAYILEAQ